MKELDKLKYTKKCKSSEGALPTLEILFLSHLSLLHISLPDLLIYGFPPLSNMHWSDGWGRRWKDTSASNC